MLKYNQYKDTRIEFIPNKIIGMTTKDGNYKVLFTPGNTYIGIKYHDGRVVGKSPNYHDLIELNNCDVSIEYEY